MRDLLRGTVRFPRNGEIFEAIEDVKIGYLTHWKALYTEGEECILRKSARIKVRVNDLEPEPVGVYADAVGYEKLEKEIIPENIRKDKKYNGYSLFVSTKVLMIISGDFHLTRAFPGRSSNNRMPSGKPKIKRWDYLQRRYITLSTR